MADIAAGDVTYTINRRDFEAGRGYKNEVTITFGDGTDTYPSGGVPLNAGKMGLPAGVIHELTFTEDAAGNGLVYKYDKSANTIRIYEVDTTGDTDKALVELDQGSDQPAAATLEVHVEGY